MDTESTSAMTKLNNITECCICLKTFVDPRILPCIHTFCLQCLKNLTDKSDKKPGDVLPCPVCRKEFIIPDDGVQGIQKNFFMAGMIEVRTALNQSKIVTPSCEACCANNPSSNIGKIPDASNRCLVCQENLCESCCKMHKSFKMSKNHEILKIGGDVGDEPVKNIQMMNCDIHRGKLLDYYCSECKKVVCVSCFVESHKTHDCKDVKTVEEEFRKIIKSNADMILALTGDLLQKKQKLERKEDFLERMVEMEEDIWQRSRELKEMIDEHTKSLMGSLFDLKNRHLKEIQTDVEELDRRVVLLESFSSYCDELRLKGSDSDVCGSKDELLRRANELEADHKVYVMGRRSPFDVTFRATHWEKLLRTANGNFVGSVKETGDRFEDTVIVIGGDHYSLNSDCYKISLQSRSEMVTLVENAPNTAKSFPAAAVYNNTMFITGIGEVFNEIWKYDLTNGWIKCGSLVQGRKYHCSEFIGEMLYICGGSKQDIVIYSVEAYNAITKKTTNIGQLKNGSQMAASVVYNDSIYLFGGLDKAGKELDSVQVFSPVGIRASSKCTILSTPMPRPCAFMGAVLWDIYAILVCYKTCIIFDLELETWQERPQFRAGPTLSAMVLDTDRIFIIGGLPRKSLEHEESHFEGLDNVRYVDASSIVRNEATEWKIHCKLPKPMFVATCAKLSLVK